MNRLKESKYKTNSVDYCNNAFLMNNLDYLK